MIKKLLPIGVSALVGAGAVFGLNVSYGDAIKAVFDKEAAKAYCAQLIDGESEETTEDAE